MEVSLPQNHVFVDFENVHQIDADVIGRKMVSFTLLIGAKQTKLDVAVVEKLLEHAGSVQLVRLGVSGKNALDFTLAYYVGRAVADDPTGFFHIVSKDTGYDALVEHLKSRHIKIRRHVDFTSLTFSAPSGPNGKPAQKNKPILSQSEQTNGKNGNSSAGALSEGASQFLDRLRKSPSNRPKKTATLKRHINAQNGNQMSDSETNEIVTALERANHIVVTEKGKVSYRI